MSPISIVIPRPVEDPSDNVCETETVQPLSNSPEPLNDRDLFNPHLAPSWPSSVSVALFPALSCLPVLAVYVKLAVPVTDTAPANAEVATKEPAKAVNPAFFQFFIFSPFRY